MTDSDATELRRTYDALLQRAKALRNNADSDATELCFSDGCRDPEVTGGWPDEFEGNATELLRKLLDERGVKWRETVNHANCTFTWWESPTFGTVHAMDNEDDTGTVFMACLNNCDFTPEQAVAATLGAGECKIIMSSTDGLCTDNPKHWYKLSCGHSFTVDGLEKPVACAVCGKTIGSYKYFTLSDLQAMYLNAKNMEDPAYHIKIAMLDIAELTQRYATILHDYESRYIDDCR